MKKEKRTELSEFQAKVWEFILGFEVDHGFTPTRVEIAQKVGGTHQNATQAIQGLVRKGYVHLSADASRNIRIIELK